METIIEKKVLKNKNILTTPLNEGIRINSRGITEAGIKLLGENLELVKREMIKPLYSAPPSSVKCRGSSGMIMLKLAKNKKELKQSSQN